MPEYAKKDTITAAGALKGESPLILVARLEPVGNLDRFQPAGFPEVGHVIYTAPRPNGREEHVCIVDSPASMANHLESLCLRSAHDLDLVDGLAGMPYLRCVTGDMVNGTLPPERREVVVTSLTEGHRIASSYFLDGQPLDGGDRVQVGGTAAAEPVKRSKKHVKDAKQGSTFADVLVKDFGIELPGSSKAHPPAAKWWEVFKTIFRYDPNALVHGVLFPQWQIKISRVLTVHLEAIGAARVDRSGVKFDRLGKTTSGQPIFAVDDTTAREIRATFILDIALVRSFGRGSASGVLGLNEEQKEFLIALALWKIDRLLASPFRFRSGCHLRCASLKEGDADVVISHDVRGAIGKAGFTDPRITDIYWPREELYREGKEETGASSEDEGQLGTGEDAETET